MEQSQAASPSWPMEILCTIDIMLSLGMGVGWGENAVGSSQFPGV